MTVVVTHTTPADSTFSSTGAAAWNADHALSGVGTMAEQNANNVAITGGTINNTTIGATTPSTGVFTTLTAQNETLKGTGQNLLIYSNTFNNTTGWNNILSLPLTTGQTDPFGGSTATLLSYNTQYQGLVERLYTCIAGVTYTASIWVRVASGTRNLLIASNNVGTTYGTITATTTWTRYSVTFTPSVNDLIIFVTDANTSGFVNTFIYGAQLELGSTANTYIPTTTTAVYGTPTLSFSGVASIGLQSDGSLYVQPAGTGAVQAQATTSSATGGNARGANAVDWQTVRSSASNVASGGQTFLGGGQNNTVGSTYCALAGGISNVSNGFASFVGGGNSNQTTAAYALTGSGRYNVSSGSYSAIVGGETNSATGIHNFIGGGFKNSGTATAAVTTQSGTMNATTAVTLSGANASIKVGQYISGTSIQSDPPTYVAAISGTSLTLSQVASGSSTSTLFFYTPHGVVVGGGNNQATGSYSFIGGGGDAGTAANRNVASGDWSVVVGGRGNTASGVGSIVLGGGYDGNYQLSNTASGAGSLVAGGVNSVAAGTWSVVLGTNNNAYAGTSSASVLGGYGGVANASQSTVVGGQYGTARGIIGNTIFAASTSPITGSVGITQSALLILGRETTNATATVLTSNTSAASTTNQVILPNNSAYYFKGSVIANVTGAANGAAWSIEGAIMRGANAASTVLIDTPSVNRVAASSGASAWVVAVTADTTNGGLAVTVTGAASTTIRWVAKLETAEVTF